MVVPGPKRKSWLRLLTGPWKMRSWATYIGNHEFESDFESFFPDLVECTQQERSDVISHMAGC